MPEAFGPRNWGLSAAETAPARIRNANKEARTAGMRVSENRRESRRRDENREADIRYNSECAMTTSNDAENLTQQGNASLSRGQAAEAIPLYEQSLQLRPGNAATLANLGMAHAELGRLDEALKWYDAALRIEPDFATAHYNRGNALRIRKQFPLALAGYEAALKCDPNFAEAWTNRGLMLMRLGRAAEAVTSYRRALAFRPNASDVHNNLGLALQVLGFVENAVSHFDESIRLNDDNPNAHTNRAQAWLLRGDFRRGWPEYEWRWRLSSHQLPPRDLPRWNGSPFAGRSLLLRHEQGLGDTIQFVRFVPQLKKLGGRVVLECPARLHPLMKSCAGLDGLIDPATAETGCDLQIPMLSVPGLLNVGFRSIPNDVPYLKAEQERVTKWRRELPKKGTRIGIGWQGNPDFPEDVYRSIPLAAFAPLAELPDVHLVNLQMGHGLEQLASFPKRSSIIELDPDRDADGAFLDTAAIMMSLDLIITSDTALAHLTGALGRPLWLPLANTPEWRWLRDRDDSPWYPTARLFRQATPGEWRSVFEMMFGQLTSRLTA